MLFFNAGNGTVSKFMALTLVTVGEGGGGSGGCYVTSLGTPSPIISIIDFLGQFIRSIHFSFFNYF